MTDLGVLCAYASDVPSALVPPAQNPQVALQYSERSTMMGTPLVDSMRAHNGMFCGFET
jgi:hypothetical protein